MADRYFAEHPIETDRVVLGPPEGHHLARVMRVAPGDAITLFDGSGAEFEAIVERVARDQVELAITRRTEIDRELPLCMTLAVALPKGDRQKWLVEKCVELGVAELVPLRTERGVAQPADSALARLRRSVIESSKQCGRNRLMQIADAQKWIDYAPTVAADRLRLIAHPSDARPLADLWRTSSTCTGADPTRGVFLAVGPEGGFTDSEVARATSCGWQAVELGRRILRVETACLALAAAIAVLADSSAAAS